MSVEEMTNDELIAETKRLREVCENLIGTADAMAEGIAMLSNPNWAILSRDEQARRTSKVFEEWTERYFYDKHNKRYR